MNFSFCLWNYHVWEFPIPLVYTSKSFYNSGSFSKIFSNLCKPTDNNLKLVLFVLFFCFLYSIVWRFSVSDTFYFLGRLIWKIDKTFFTIFHLRFIWSLLSYRFDPAFWFTSAGTKCFGSSPIINGKRSSDGFQTNCIQISVDVEVDKWSSGGRKNLKQTQLAKNLRRFERS